MQKFASVLSVMVCVVLVASVALAAGPVQSASQKGALQKGVVQGPAQKAGACQKGAGAIQKGVVQGPAQKAGACQKGAAAIQKGVPAAASAFENKRLQLGSGRVNRARPTRGTATNNNYFFDHLWRPFVGDFARYPVQDTKPYIIDAASACFPVGAAACGSAGPGDNSESVKPQAAVPMR